MTKQGKIREGIKSIFSEDMLLCFWTHEKCPPNVNDGFKRCHLDRDIKHERCMPCWKKWVDELVEKVLQELHSQGVVIRVDKELPQETPKLCVVNLVEGRGYPRCMAGLFEPLIEDK